MVVATAVLQPLNAAGTLLMAGCVGFVLALLGFCLWRLMRRQPAGNQDRSPIGR